MTDNSIIEKYSQTWEADLFDLDGRLVSSKNLEDADEFLERMQLTDPEAPSKTLAKLDQNSTLEEWINALESNNNSNLGEPKTEFFKDLAQMTNAEQLAQIYEYFDQNPRDRSMLTSAIRDYSSDEVKVAFLSELKDLSKNPDSSIMLDGSNLDTINAAEILENLSDKPDQLKKSCNALNDDILANVLEASLYAREEIDPQNYNQRISFPLDPDDTAFSNIINGVRNSEDVDFIARIDAIAATLPDVSIKPMVCQPADADESYIQAVNTTGEALKNARTGGNPKKIEAAYNKYKEALMAELENSYSIRKNDTLETGAFLQDDQALQTAAQKVMENHKGQNYDADLEASIQAIIIAKQAEYEVGGTGVKVDAQKATVALKGIGDQLGLLEGSQDTVKDLVLNDPAVKQYNQIIVDAMTNPVKPANERLESFGDSVETLSKSAYNLAPNLLETALGELYTTDQNVIATLIESTEATEEQPLHMKSVNQIYTSVADAPIADDVQNIIANAMAKKLTSTNQSFLKPQTDSGNPILDLFNDIKDNIEDLFSGNKDSDSKVPATNIGNIYVKADNSINPDLYTDIINELNSDPTAHKAIIDVLYQKQFDAMENNPSTTDQNTSSGSDDSAPPEDLIQATNKAKKEYDQETDPDKKAEKLTELHECLAKEVDYAGEQIETSNLFFSSDAVVNNAIGMVTQEYHTGEEGEELLAFTQAASVLNLAEDPDCNTVEKKLNAMAESMVLYKGKQAVIDQILGDTRTQQYINDIAGNLKEGQASSNWFTTNFIGRVTLWGDEMLTPEGRVHYLAQAVNACGSSSDLAKALLESTLPLIEADIQNLPLCNASTYTDNNASITVDDSASSLTDLCDIASPLNNKSSLTLYDRMVALTADYLEKEDSQIIDTSDSIIDHWKSKLECITKTAVGKNGADPALLLDVSNSSHFTQTGPYIFNRSEAINVGVAKGVEMFCTTTFPESMATTEQSLEQVHFLNADVNPWVDSGPVEGLTSYLQSVDKICDNPEVKENTAALEDMCARSFRMFNSLNNQSATLQTYHLFDDSNNSNKNIQAQGLSDDINTIVADFLEDDKIKWTLQESKSFAYNLGSAEDFNSTGASLGIGGKLRIGLQRLLGIRITKVAAMNATAYAQQGDFNLFGKEIRGVDKGVELLCDCYDNPWLGLPKEYLTQDKIDEFYQGLTRINKAQTNYQKALKIYNEDVALNYDVESVNAAKRTLVEAEAELDQALKEKPSVDLSYDVSTTAGKLFRGFGLTLNAAGLVAALSDPNAENSGEMVVVGAANTAQNIALIYTMIKENKAFMLGNTADRAKWLALKKNLDNLGDGMIFISVMTAKYFMDQHITDEDWFAVATDGVSITGGLAAYIGTQLGKTNVGTFMTKAGGYLTIAALVMVSAEAGKEWYDHTHVYPHRFENDITQESWENGAQMSDGDLLMRCSDDGIGAGVVMQADALMNGYDINDSEDLALYKDYINDMSRKEKEIYIDGLFDWLEASELDLEKGYPQAEEINNYEAHQDFQQYLQENNVALPPVKLK